LKARLVTGKGHEGSREGQTTCNDVILCSQEQTHPEKPQNLMEGKQDIFG